MLGSLLFFQSLEMSLGTIGTKLILLKGMLEIQHKVTKVLII